MDNQIDHVSEAKLWLENAKNSQASKEPETLTVAYAGIAQAHATLAMAEQQRIANLLTAMTSYNRWPSREVGKSYGDVVRVLASQVRDGLGLS